MPLGEAVTHREAGKAVGYYNTCVIQQRVERAKRLLRQPGSSIAAIAKGNRLGVDGYLRLLEKRDRIIHQMAQFLRQWDGWQCPVAPMTAIAHCKVGTLLQIGTQSYPYADLTTPRESSDGDSPEGFLNFRKTDS